MQATRKRIDETVGAERSVRREALAVSIGTAVRRAREAKNLTQEDVADMLGISSEFYARLERGHALPSVPTLARMAHLLQVDVDTMLGRKSDRVWTRPMRGKSPEPTQNLQLERPEVRRLIRRIRDARPRTRRLVAYLLRELEKSTTNG